MGPTNKVYGRVWNLVGKKLKSIDAAYAKCTVRSILHLMGLK